MLNLLFAHIECEDGWTLTGADAVYERDEQDRIWQYKCAKVDSASELAIDLNQCDEVALCPGGREQCSDKGDHADWQSGDQEAVVGMKGVR